MSFYFTQIRSVEEIITLIRFKLLYSVSSAYCLPLNTQCLLWRTKRRTVNIISISPAYCTTEHYLIGVVEPRQIQCPHFLLLFLRMEMIQWSLLGRKVNAANASTGNCPEFTALLILLQFVCTLSSGGINADPSSLSLQADFVWSCRFVKKVAAQLLLQPSLHRLCGYEPGSPQRPAVAGLRTRHWTQRFVLVVR